MRTTLNISTLAIILPNIFICSAPVLAAGTGADTGSASTVSATSGNYGKTVGAQEVQTIQQELETAEAKANANASSNRSGTAGGNSAALYQAPFASNPGTLAESAKTTALSTSTYNH